MIIGNSIEVNRKRVEVLLHDLRLCSKLQHTRRNLIEMEIDSLYVGNAIERAKVAKEVRDIYHANKWL